MVYVRQALQIEHYAHSEWVDTPARMLAPLLVGTLSQRSVARAVVADSSAASGDLRLHTELLRLQQSFESRPSRVQFSLRATLLDEASRQVLAVREFDASVAAPRRTAGRSAGPITGPGPNQPECGRRAGFRAA